MKPAASSKPCTFYNKLLGNFFYCAEAPLVAKWKFSIFTAFPLTEQLLQPLLSRWDGGLAHGSLISALPATATSRARAGAGLWAPSAGKLGRSRARPLLIPPTPWLRGRDMGETGLIFLIFSVLQMSCQSPKSSEPFCCLGDFLIFKQGKGPLGVSYTYIVKHPKMSLLHLNITVTQGIRASICRREIQSSFYVLHT